MGSESTEALTVAMAIVPGLYARNRMFALYTDPELQRARARAALLRGLVAQLAGRFGPVSDLEFAPREGAVRLTFRIAELHLLRRAELTALEAMGLRLLASRAKIPGISLGPGDRERLVAALRRLATPIDLRAVEVATSSS